MKRKNPLIINDSIVPKGWAVAVGRFQVDGYRYRAATVPNAVLRKTRLGAMVDEYNYLESRRENPAPVREELKSAALFLESSGYIVREILCTPEPGLHIVATERDITVGVMVRTEERDEANDITDRWALVRDCAVRAIDRLDIIDIRSSPASLHHHTDIGYCGAT